MVSTFYYSTFFAFYVLLLLILLNIILLFFTINIIKYRAEIANGHLVEDFIQHALDLSHAYIHIHIQTYRHTDILIMSLSRQTMRMCMNDCNDAYLHTNVRMHAHS